MDVKQLHVFAAVSEHGSFTKAAIALDCSQSHVTTVVRRLEERLGAVLFDRLGRGVRLTDAGRSLLPYAHRIEALFAEAEASVAATTARGTLSIAAHESLTIYRLPELLVALRKATPDLEIHVTTVEETRIPRAAIDGAVDVAFVYAAANRRDRVNEVVLNEEAPVVASSPDFRTETSGELSIADIENLPGFVTTRPCPGRLSFDRTLERIGVSTHRIREFASVEAIKQCALRGLGYAVLPRVAVQRELDHEQLVELRPFAELEKVTTILIFAPEKTQALEAFVSATRALYARWVAAGLTE